MDGGVFAFNSKHMAMRYDCASGVWSETSLTIEGHCMVPHPCKNGRVIELMVDGSVREVHIADGRVEKTYSSAYGALENLPEILALPRRDGEFIVLLCDGKNKQPWRVFSSATGNWTETNWKTTGAQSHTAFHDPETQTLYYHVHKRRTRAQIPLNPSIF